jgi:hypothetical protein
VRSLSGMHVPHKGECAAVEQPWAGDKQGPDPFPHKGGGDSDKVGPTDWSSSPGPLLFFP